jgi:hypothetical protein
MEDKMPTLSSFSDELVTRHRHCCCRSDGSFLPAQEIPVTIGGSQQSAMRHSSVQTPQESKANYE